MISSQLNWIMFANFCKNLLTLQLKSIPHIRHMHHMWCRCQNFKPVVGRGQVLSLNICPAPPFTEHLVMFLKKWLPACYQWPTRSYILHPVLPTEAQVILKMRQLLLLLAAASSSTANMKQLVLDTGFSTATATTSDATCPLGWVDAGTLGCFLLESKMAAVSWIEALEYCEEQVCSPYDVRLGSNWTLFNSGILRVQSLKRTLFAFFPFLYMSASLTRDTKSLGPLCLWWCVNNISSGWFLGRAQDRGAVELPD